MWKFYGACQFWQWRYKTENLDFWWWSDCGTCQKVRVISVFLPSGCVCSSSVYVSSTNWLSSRSAHDSLENKVEASKDFGLLMVGRSAQPDSFSSSRTAGAEARTLSRIDNSHWRQDHPVLKIPQPQCLWSSSWGTQRTKHARKIMSPCNWRYTAAVCCNRYGMKKLRVWNQKKQQRRRSFRYSFFSSPLCFTWY